MAKTVQGYANDRTKLIDDLIEQLENAVTKAQERLYRKLLDAFTNGLDVDEDGRIKNSRKNKRMLSTVDAVFNAFGAADGLAILQTVVRGVDEVIKFNGKYASGLGNGAGLADVDLSIRQTMNEWLGIDKGAVKPNGYLDTIIKDTSIRNTVKDLVLKQVISQDGQAATRAKLEKLIVGGPDELGALQRYTKGFVQDTFSVADRVVGLEYADKMGYNFAIYEGGLIKTSRAFCIKRNGKVFHRSEIAKFNPTEAKPADYNPFTDLGGYNCRHHLNWIPDSLAIELRPDAKSFLIAA